VLISVATLALTHHLGAVWDYENLLNTIRSCQAAPIIGEDGCADTAVLESLKASIDPKPPLTAVEFVTDPSASWIESFFGLQADKKRVSV
jgi:hypothetical protein